MNEDFERKRLRATKNGWQPIETAPKDGTQVLVGAETLFMDVWMAVASFWPCNMYWTEATASGMKLNQPTHWQPLPQPWLDRLKPLDPHRHLQEQGRRSEAE